jgi:Flp pilus assembly protein TadD
MFTNRREFQILWGLLAAILWASMIGAAAAATKADEAFQQAQQAFKTGDFAAAVAHLDKAVQLDQKQAKFLGVRGVAHVRNGDYAKGLADLKAAIALNPDDAGHKYRPSADAKLSPDALKHGEKQLAQMLHDRPPMAQFGADAEFVRRWAVRKFAGEDFGALIDWDPSPPLHSDAEHLSASPDGSVHAAILVLANHTHGPNGGQPRSFEELWAGAVYELHNVTHSREFARLNDEAAEGKLSKEEFVARILKHELLAAQETRAFYVQVYLPWAEKRKLSTDPTLWFCDWWDSAAHVLDSFRDKAAYPWHPYGRQYDWMAVHRLWQRDEFQKARAVLEKMRTEHGHDGDEGEVCCWLGRCLAKLGKPSEALAALNESISLDPEDSAAYRARGEVYRQLGKTAAADADLARAKELEEDR